MNRSALLKITGAVLLAFILLVGCREEQAEETGGNIPPHQEQVSTKTQQTAADILVTVNGSSITQDELDQAVVRLVGEETASNLEEQAKKKILESLVMSRAISQARLNEMGEAEKNQLEVEVNAYREQLLTRQYIAGHGVPQPISIEEIKQYYGAHPEQFGAKTIKKYEMITAKRPLTAAEKDEVLHQLEQPEKHKDWPKWAADLAGQGYPLVYRQGRDDEKLLHQKLSKLLSSLTTNEKPQLLFIRKIPYLVRLTDIENPPPQPLGQVTAKIRKILARQQIKKTVEKLSKEVLAKAEVKFAD